jgi:ferritin-like metal-binding protein YciE
LQQRIIPDVENLETAMKIVRDVELAYHRTIEENISYWWAVEEDIIQSYTKLMNQTDNERVKATLSKIIPDLKNHVEVLESMRESFKKILADVKNHGEMIQALYFEEPKQPVGVVVDEAKSKQQCEELEKVWDTLNEAAAELGKQIPLLPPDIGVSLRGVRALINLCKSHPSVERPCELRVHQCHNPSDSHNEERCVDISHPRNPYSFRTHLMDKPRDEENALGSFPLR